MRTIIYFTLIVLLASIGAGKALIITNDTVMAEPPDLGVVLELNDSNVNSEISQYPLFVLDCYVSWCEPCEDLSADLNELSSELVGQVAFGSINLETNEKAKEQFDITMYPTILYFKNGTLVDSQIGYGSKSEFVERLQMIDPDLNVGNVEPGERRIIHMPSPSEIMPSRMPRNISSDKMQIMPSPAPEAFRQFVENVSSNNNSLNFSTNNSIF